MDKETRKKAIEILRAHGYDIDVVMSDAAIADVLDDAVHELVSQEATGINNAGPEEQVEYLKGMLPPDKKDPEDFEVSIRVVHFRELPGGGFFLDEWSHKLGFSWGDAEHTLVTVEAVTADVCEALDSEDDALNLILLRGLSDALKEIPDGVLIAFDG